MQEELRKKQEQLLKLKAELERKIAKEQAKREAKAKEREKEKELKVQLPTVQEANERVLQIVTLGDRVHVLTDERLISWCRGSDNLQEICFTERQMSVFEDGILAFTRETGFALLIDGQLFDVKHPGTLISCFRINHDLLRVVLTSQNCLMIINLHLQDGRIDELELIDYDDLTVQKEFLIIRQSERSTIW